MMEALPARGVRDTVNHALERAVAEAGDKVFLDFSGTTYTFDADAVSSGTYEDKVIAQGAGQRADDDIAVMTVGGAACGCGFDAESVCDDGGAVIAIALEGPVPNQFVVCRLIPAGQGSPPASTDELRCEDADGDDEADLFDGATLTSQFGIGFCGIP